MTCLGTSYRSVVLVVALQTGAGANGGIASLTEIMRSLDRYRPVLITNLDSALTEKWRAEGIEVHVVPEQASRGIRKAPLATAMTYWRYFRAVRRILNSTGARIVHANDPLAFQLALTPVRVARRSVRLALNVRDTLSPDRPVPRKRYRWLFAQADHTFFLSQDMRSRWEQAIDRPIAAASATYSIVDFERFRTTPLPDEAPASVLVSGVICVKKGQLRYLEKVAPRLAQANIVSWLSGDFDDTNSDYAKACAEAARPLGEHVRFLGYRSDIPDLIAGARVVCVASRYEGLMRTMIEAMAMGRPVVSTAVASAREMLAVDGRPAGTVVSLDFGDDMADALIDLCSDLGKNSALGANGALIARELFERRSVVEAYQQVYDDLWGPPPNHKRRSKSS